MSSPEQILSLALQRSSASLESPIIADETIRSRIEYICRCLSNRAAARLLLACSLAKCDRPRIDPRQPYTAIGGEQSFSGRGYDEQYVDALIRAERLPCNATTAFLTPALRNVDQPLTTDIEIVGHPKQVYSKTLLVLDDIANNRVSAEDVLSETIRSLVQIREEKSSRMATLLAGIKRGQGGLPLASEAILTLIEQHLACKHSSRLPVLVVAAAYQAASNKLGECVVPLNTHNAADKQTGSLGDIEVCLKNDDRVITGYEMKLKRVTVADIDQAVTKIASHNPRIDNYVFITTDAIDADVAEYAASLYETLGGVEVVILDCIGFLRHFLHLFHRLRISFLDAYQEFVLTEPDSAVRQPLKEAFLALRQAAESDE